MESIRVFVGGSVGVLKKQLPPAEACGSLRHFGSVVSILLVDR